MNGNCETGCTDKKALLRQINAVSFTLDELRLYLDTHPRCEQGLRLFRDYQEERSELLARYESAGGSLVWDQINTDNGWQWNDGAMPWKAEAN